MFMSLFLRKPRWCRGLRMLALAVLAAGFQARPCAAQATAPAARPTLAVLMLRGLFQTPKSPEERAAGTPAHHYYPLGEVLVQRIDMAYLKTGRFQVIERSQMKAVLKEGALEQQGLVDDATAVTLGKQLGAKYVLVGSYHGGMARGVDVQGHLFGKDSREDFHAAKLEVRLRMVRTEDGTILEPMILGATAKDPVSSKAFSKLMDDFALALDRELRLRYPLTGYVVKVLSDKEVLADLGRSQGVEPGDVFQVVEVGPEVIHPVTGKAVPGERKVVGELVVTALGQESSTLRAASGRPALKPGYVLERKPKN